MDSRVVCFNLYKNREKGCSVITFLKYLFPDAEAREDFAEDVVGGDGAGDFAEVVEGFAYVLRYEVARNAHVDAVDGAGD